MIVEKKIRKYGGTGRSARFKIQSLLKYCAKIINMIINNNNNNNNNNEEYILKCNICDHKIFTELLKFQKFYLSKCNNCNFVFSRKIPTIEMINKCYEGYDRLVLLSAESQKNIERLIRKQIKRYEFDNVLDIGCGNGEFLNIYKKFGKKTFFTEFGEDLIYQLKQKHEFIESEMKPVSKKKFDLVILSEVIEHTNDPKSLINSISKLQNKNGLIYITTPNYNCLESKILKSNYGIFTYPEHLSYFTIKTLDNLLKQKGYKKIYGYSSNISFFRFLEFFNKKNIIKIDANKSSDKIQYLSKKGGLIYIKYLISYILKLLNLGNTLYFYYIKNE